MYHTFEAYSKLELGHMNDRMNLAMIRKLGFISNNSHLLQLRMAQSI
jgi:hypothetical protein